MISVAVVFTCGTLFVAIVVLSASINSAAAMPMAVTVADAAYSCFIFVYTIS
jgi:hypothetical protein